MRPWQVTVEKQELSGLLLSLPKSVSSAQEIAAEVLKDADGALHALVSSVWPNIAMHSPEKLQMLLDMLRRICTEKARSQPIRRCRSYVIANSHVADIMHNFFALSAA